jgi:hypothetical protein
MALPDPTQSKRRQNVQALRFGMEVESLNADI